MVPADQNRRAQPKQNCNYINYSLYTVTGIPVGLKNAPETFQRAMSTILASAKRRFTLVYLDDIVVFTTLMAEVITYV